jgi:hypothetical protein
MAKSLIQKMRELRKPADTWDKRVTKREKAIGKAVKSATMASNGKKNGKS